MDCSRSLQDLLGSKPWINFRDFHFTERALQMRSPCAKRDRDRSFFSADLIPPVEICYLYGPAQ